MIARKHGISPVIATILLLAITVVISVGVWQFLQGYTEDTFDDISGDATIDLAFANKVVVFDRSGTTLAVSIAQTTYESNLQFDEFIFAGSSGTTICNTTENGSTSHLVKASQANTFVFNSTDCALSNGEYDLIMTGNATVRVDNIVYG